ncbi:alpha/beta fold hydrolase [Streptomyces sp. NPDC005805]|uniref:alpha/beta fold hydrolase n=1 Tax=Streptomyces sp. NPDC005805 TaxID=3157068 RepID=UPI0033F7E9CD
MTTTVHATRVSAARVTVEQQLAVSLSPGGPLDHQVFVTLSVPAAGPVPRTVQVQSGPFMWNHRYWDFEDAVDGTNRYDWTAHAVARGHATVAIDRIGIDRSSRPAAALVDAESNAHVNHQVLRAARAGLLHGPGGPVAFDNVVMVSHSYSTALAEMILTADPHVCELAVMSGFTHRPRLDNFGTRVLANLRDAEDRPSGYRTTVPGSRHTIFYWPAETPDEVLEYDEVTTRTTLTTAEWDSLTAFFDRTIDIRVPVLFALGQEDPLFAAGPPPEGPYGSDTSSVAAFLAEEQPHLGAQVPELTGFLLPGAGHNLNVMPNATQWFDFAQNWLAERL